MFQDSRRASRTYRSSYRSIQGTGKAAEGEITYYWVAAHDARVVEAEGKHPGNVEGVSQNSIAEICALTAPLRPRYSYHGPHSLGHD